jgi:hypothetical protein
VIDAVRRQPALTAPAAVLDGLLLHAVVDDELDIPGA